METKEVLEMIGGRQDSLLVDSLANRIVNYSIAETGVDNKSATMKHAADLVERTMEVLITRIEQLVDSLDGLDETTGSSDGGKDG